MPTVTDEVIDRVVRTVEYNTGDGGPNAIDVAQIRVHLCANSQYPIKEVNQAIVAALERGDLVEQEDGYVPAEPETY